MYKNILRIVDANFNRSREGLRVCEEIARFVLNSRQLTDECKSVRHGITSVVKDLASRGLNLSQYRDVEGDVGKCSAIRSEMSRISYADIFAANAERVKESLRVLEEFLKIIDKDRSPSCSRLRFRVYAIEKKAMKKLVSFSDANRKN